jgi:phage terminase large subunit-like protein
VAIPGTARLPSTRAAAKAWYGDILRAAAAKSEEHLLRQRRWLSRSDLFYLLTVSCKRPDIDRDWLFDRCREVQAAPYDHADLWARFHYKSSIKTFGLNMLEILNDAEVTIGIFSETNKVAKPFLRQIKRELETNDDLKEQFPDILWSDPQREAPKWSEDEGIVVKRRGNPKESTVEAFGLVDGQPTGRHFRKLDYDDVVTEDSVGNADQIEKVKNRLRMSFNLGSGKATLLSMSGTRYHLFDAYRMVMDENILAPRIHAATHNGKENGRPVFLGADEMATHRTRLGPYLFASQMLLDPTADGAQSFKPEWLRYWPCLAFHNMTMLMIVDPAGSKKRKSNDFTSAWVLGYGADLKWRVCDYVRDRLNLAERTRMVFGLHRRWRPSKVGYEEYGLQADIEHMEHVQDEENYRFSITPLGGQLAKEERIKRLVPTFEQERILLPKTGLLKVDHRGHSVDVIKQFVEQEYAAFPVLAHDDGLDALSRIHDDEMKVVPPAPDTQPEDEDEMQELDWVSR